MTSSTLSFSALLLFCVSLVASQENPPPLEDILNPIFLPNINQAAAVLFPPSIITAQTPVAIRYVLVFSAGTYDIQAACSPVSLSFLGTRRTMPARFCRSGLSKAIITSQVLYRLLISEFPVEGRPYGRFLIENGLNPLDTSTDVDTEIGWANVAADRLLKYFKRDGWNSGGDLTKTNYRVQYQDSSGYQPQNIPTLNPHELRKPLRWQPLTGDIDRHGNAASQVHITPQIAVNVDPLVLSRSEFRRRKAPPLYSTPNRRNDIGKRDKRFALDLIRKLFKRSRSATAKKIVTAYYWENKFLSLGTFIAFYQLALGFNNEIATQLGLAEVMAQYDALLVAWKEKRRHDNVRPTTLIRRLLKGKKVRAFRGVRKGVGLVDAEEWEPIVPIQPHSEYPSASALICSASFDHLEVGLEKLVLQGNGTLPPYELLLPPQSLPNSPVEEAITITFKTLKQADRSCGISRLNGGVHFLPSVPTGRKLGKGIGVAAFEHVRDLVNGQKPKHCTRCA